MLGRECLRPFRDDSGRHEVCGFIRQVAREVRRLGEDAPRLDATLEGRQIAAAGFDECDRVHRPARPVLGARMMPVEAVQPEEEALRQRAARSLRVEAVRGLGADGDATSIDAPERSAEVAGARAEALDRMCVWFADAMHDHALGRRLAEGGDLGHLASAA